MTPTAAAVFLSGRVPVIACREDAGRCFVEVKQAIDSIERMINRPKQPRPLGPCPSWVSSGHDKDCQNSHPHQCAIALSAVRGADEVECPHCHATHNVESLIEKQLADADDKSFTLSELWKVMLPALELYVPLRTLQDWSARGRLMPTGYDKENKPKFLLRDVRELWEARPQRGITGAAAHKTQVA